MGDFDLRGCGVTADALDTQKENQKTAYDEIKEYFAAQKLLKEVMAAGGEYLKRNRKRIQQHSHKRILHNNSCNPRCSKSIMR